MPRMDNSHPVILESFDLVYDDNDPGNTEPVDLCLFCATEYPYDLSQLEHPSYENDDIYICLNCGDSLIMGDN